MSIENAIFLMFVMIRLFFYFTVCKCRHESCIKCYLINIHYFSASGDTKPCGQYNLFCALYGHSEGN